jgi:sugar lactone lactonase YvrE
VDDESFYVTNDHAEKQIWKMFLKDFADICTGNVVYYGKSKASIALDGLCFANGINKNQDGSLYFVAESTNGKLSVLKPLAKYEDFVSMQFTIPQPQLGNHKVHPN